MRGNNNNKATPADNMDATPSDSSSNNNNADSALFSSICGATSFATNAGAAVLTISRKLTPSEVSVLSSLLISADISYLSLRKELPPGAADQLGSAIKSASSTIRTLFLGYCCDPAVARTPELFQTFLASANPALEQVSINHNFEGDWHDPKLADSFGRFTSLRSLTVTASEPYSYRILPLATVIGRLQVLESLIVSRIRFVDQDEEILAAALKGLPLLANLGISFSLIGAEAAKVIGEVVALGKIRKLRLGLNQLDDKQASALIDAILASLRNRCYLEELDLSHNDIGPKGGEKLSEELIARSPRLRALNLSGNPIGDATALGKVLPQSLGELEVSECNLGPSGVESLLSAAILRSSQLSVLKISGNNQGDSGARTVAGFLCSSGGRKLIEFEMQRSGITEIGALELAAAFAKNYTLKCIDICENSLGPRGAAAVIDALATAGSTIPMDTINLRRCRIGDDGAAAAGRLIVRRGCKRLLLNDNEVHATGMKAIADSVAKSACIIQNLNLSRNPLDDEGVKCFLDKITQHPRLVRELYITCTKMRAEGARAVKRALEAGSVTCQLILNVCDGDEEANGILREVERDSRSTEAAKLFLW